MRIAENSGIKFTERTMNAFLFPSNCSVGLFKRFKCGWHQFEMQMVYLIKHHFSYL